MTIDGETAANQRQTSGVITQTQRFAHRETLALEMGRRELTKRRERGEDG
jgi:hypothetical protein